MKNYSHPHDEYVMNDNTKITTSDRTDNSDPVLFQPFFSSKGEDGKIIRFTEYSKMREEYGDPDINLYGQSYYHVLNWLENGGYVQGVRLTAKDATYANSMLVLDIKTTEIQKTNKAGDPLYLTPTGEETTISSGNSAIMIKHAKVKHRILAFSRIAQDKEDIKSLMRTQFKDDEDGKHIPLLCFVSKGRGSYGAMYRWRLTPNIQRDKSTKFRNYNLELYKNEDGLTRDPITPIIVSTLPTAKNIARQSEFIEDVASRNDLSVRVIGLEDGFDAAFKALYDVVSQTDDSVTKEQIDVLTFFDSSLNRYENVEVDTETVDITALEGHGLQNGSDGEFDLSNPNREDAMHRRLEDLFNGDVDPSVTDTQEHLISLTLDANYPLEVKKTMCAWRKLRDDHVLILDASLMYTNPSLKGWMKEDLDEHIFGVTLLVQNFETYDKYTGKYIRVTAPYLYSILFPAFVRANGTQTPFAGLDIPLNSYIREGSLKPVISNPQDKSDIYELGGNYICKESGKYIFGSNITTQLEESELRYVNNVLVYYEIKRDLLSLSTIFRFKFSDSADDLKVLNNIATSRLAKYQDIKCKAIQVSVSNDTTDPTGKTLVTECSVGFRTFDLNNKINVNIERY